MKILLINSVYGCGSTGSLVADLNKFFLDCGNEVMVAFGRGNKPEDCFNAIKIASSVEVYGHALRTRIKGFTWCGGSPKATKRLIDLVNDFQPDIVNVHEIHGYYLNSNEALAFLKTLGIPVVLTLHDFVTFTGKCGHPVECTKFQTKCENCPKISAYPTSWFFDRSSFEFEQKLELFRNFDQLTLVAVSEWLANEAKKSTIFKNREISIIENGINVSVFSNALKKRRITSDLPSNKTIILSVCSNFRDLMKGTAFLIDVINEFSEKDNVVFWLVGAHSETLLSNIKHPDFVRSFGYVGKEGELANFFAKADYFFLPSVRETFSLTTAESLCVGTPIVGLEGCGAPELLTSQGGGAFYSGRSPKIYADWLRERIAKNDLFVSEAVSSSCKSRFSRERMCSSYAALFDSLIQR